MEGHEIFALKNYKPQSFATQSPRWWSANNWQRQSLGQNDVDSELDWVFGRRKQQGYL
jgi:hypothetical protein